MAEYIGRDAAVKVVLRERKPTNSVAQNRMLSVIQHDLLTMRAADVATVVHGRWMKHIKGGTLCSRCGSYTQHNGDVLDMSKAIACPWCGAKMDGGADHEDD